MRLFNLLIKRLILALLLTPLIVIPVAYFTAQTQQGAVWISRWLSNANNSYQISVKSIHHSFISPLRVDIEGLLVKQGNKEIINVANAFAIFNGNPLSNPNWLWHLQLENGRIHVRYPSLNAISLRSDWLLIKNIDLDIVTPDGEITLRKVNAGVSPWTPNNTHFDSTFRLSAPDISVNGYASRNLLILGGMRKGQLVINAFGADLPNGNITARGTKIRGSSKWIVNNLYLNHFRWQGSESAPQFVKKIALLPELDIKKLTIVNANLEGDGWALNDANLMLQNVQWQGGDWIARDSLINFSADSIVYGDIHIGDPIVKLAVNERDITLKQVNARWQGGLFKTEGAWRNGELTLNTLIVSAVEYTLPSNWRALFDYQFPDWLSALRVNSLKSGRNVIIDVNPQFPFQLTLLDIDGSNLSLIDKRRFGLWRGELSAYADNATFNKIDIRYPKLELSGEADELSARFSSFIDRGLLEGSLTADKHDRRRFNLDLSGQSVPLEFISHWGWRAQPLSGEGDIRFSLGAAPGSAELSGRLEAVNSAGQIFTQTLAQTEPNGGASVKPDGERNQRADDTASTAPSAANDDAQ